MASALKQTSCVQRYKTKADGQKQRKGLSYILVKSRWVKLWQTDQTSLRKCQVSIAMGLKKGVSYSSGRSSALSFATLLPHAGGLGRGGGDLTLALLSLLLLFTP